MKKYFFYFILIGLVYIITIYIISIKFGLPPFNKGFIIGYPAIYYQFEMRDGTDQHGTMSTIDVLINIIIVFALTSLFIKIKNYISCK